MRTGNQRRQRAEGRVQGTTERFMVEEAQQLLCECWGLGVGRAQRQREQEASQGPRVRVVGDPVWPVLAGAGGCSDEALVLADRWTLVQQTRSTKVTQPPAQAAPIRASRKTAGHRRNRLGTRTLRP